MKITDNIAQSIAATKEQTARALVAGARRMAEVEAARGIKASFSDIFRDKFIDLTERLSPTKWERSDRLDIIRRAQELAGATARAA